MASVAEIGLDNVCQELEKQFCITYLIFSDIWDVKCSMDIIWKKWFMILFKKVDCKSAREYYNELNIYAP